MQPPDPLELWESPPYELVERDGWLYARGIADDKGQLYMLLKAAELLAADGGLPVNLRFACDGEEEVGGHSIVDWIQQDERGADAAVVFDGGMVERDVPAFNIAVRGLCYFHVTVRAGNRDLHSGIYGGASLNAMHAHRPDAVRRDAARRAGAGGAAGGDRAAVTGGARGLEKPAAGRGGDRGGGLPAGGRRGGGGVLSAHLGRAFGRRARHQRRLADPAEDRDPGRGESRTSPSGWPPGRTRP